MPRIVVLDFDGVIHSYTSGWKGHKVIADPPMPGAFEFIRQVVSHPEFDLAVLSSRSSSVLGRRVMRDWFLAHGLEAHILDEIDFPEHKPPAFVSIDDRVIPFRGTFPSLEELEDFQPWKLP